MQSGILELDVHDMNKFQAKTYIDSRLKQAKNDVYIIRIIHGFNRGTALRDMIRKEYRSNPKVKRVELSMNPGITDLILRDLV
ncbi:MAG TPA: Smr/MutS family protein [Bacillota bacterium]|nr:Smr/MutS family protein [Bacillota bacterium]